MRGGRVSHNYRAIRCKWGIAQMCSVKLEASGGGVSHHFGVVLIALKKCRAIWGIAAIVSQYRAIWATKTGASQKGGSKRVVWQNFPCTKLSSNRFLSSAGVGKSRVLPERVPSPSPTLDKILHPWVQELCPVLGSGLEEAPPAFPDANIHWIHFSLYRNFLQKVCPAVLLWQRQNHPFTKPPFCFLAIVLLP